MGQTGQRLVTEETSSMHLAEDELVPAAVFFDGTLHRSGGLDAEVVNVEAVS